MTGRAKTRPPVKKTRLSRSLQPQPNQWDALTEEGCFGLRSRMTSITRTNMPYRVLTEMSSPVEKRGDNRRGDHPRGDDRRGGNRQESRRDDHRADRRRPDEDRVSKPSGPLCPFCHRTKAQWPLSMCPECLVADHRHWNCPKKQCHGCYLYGHVAHCCPGNPKGEFYEPSYLPCVAAGEARLSRYRTPHASRCPASLFHTGNERRKPENYLLEPLCRLRHRQPTPGTSGRSHACHLPRRRGAR